MKLKLRKNSISKYLGGGVWFKPKKLSFKIFFLMDSRFQQPKVMVFCIQSMLNSYFSLKASIEVMN